MCENKSLKKVILSSIMGFLIGYLISGNEFGQLVALHFIVVNLVELILNNNKVEYYKRDVDNGPEYKAKCNY